MDPYCGSKLEELGIPVLLAIALILRRQWDLGGEADDLRLHR